MEIRLIRRPPRAGFTLIEMMIVVSIIGILSAIAIPVFSKQQLRTKSTEAKTNLSAIRVAQQSNFSELGLYQAARAEPQGIPGTQPADFDFAGSDYAEIGWAPEGRVYFSYAIAISPDASGFTADAAADIDGDGVVQIWGYTKRPGTGGLVLGGLGCDPNQLIPEIAGSCLLDSSIF